VLELKELLYLEEKGAPARGAGDLLTAFFHQDGNIRRVAVREFLGKFGNDEVEQLTTFQAVNRGSHLWGFDYDCRFGCMNHTGSVPDS
jgi:hypothetical protein